MDTSQEELSGMNNGYFIKNPSEEVAEEVVNWFGFLATAPIRFDIDECHHLVSGAYKVMLVEGHSEGVRRIEKAVELIEQEAVSIAPNFDFNSADRYLIQINYSQEIPLMVEELMPVQKLMSSFPEDADVAWGISKQENDNKIRIRVAAANLKRN